MMDSSTHRIGYDHATDRRQPHDLVAEIVTLAVEETDGVFIVTSPERPEFVLAHEDPTPLTGEVRDVRTMIYRRRLDVEVSVVPARLASDGSPRGLGAPWAVLVPSDPDGNLG